MADYKKKDIFTLQILIIKDWQVQQKTKKIHKILSQFFEFFFADFAEFCWILKNSYK